MEFEAWQHAEGEWTPPTNEEWDRISERLLPALRIAWFTMYKSKPELEQISESLDDDAFKEMVNAIIDAQRIFQEAAGLLQGAEVRLMCSAASAIKKNDPEGLVGA